MSFKTYPSGSSKRRRAKPIEKLVQAQKGDIYNGVSINPNDLLAIVAVEKEQPTSDISESDQHEENIDTNIGDSNVSGSNVHKSS